MAERPRANSLAVEMPESVASSGTSVSSGNNVRTVSRRSRASTVNMVEPEAFEVGFLGKFPNYVEEEVVAQF